jgi:asparagine synthetase B (glutamine-hydrolysing)
MGGLAVSVEWAAGPAPELFDAMVSSMGHRGPAGIRTTGDGTALIAEARLPRDGHDGWHIATLGPLTLVGDLRLWTTDDLAHASGTDTDDPRMLVLHGYAAMGAAVMVLVDGDFAFAIWDADTGTLFAARDRFGIKPLWIQRTATGVRLASGTNQLVAASDPPPAPDDLTVARFLNDEIPYDERSFHDGIVRLMPAHTLTATQATFTTSPYWDLSDIPQRPCDDVPGRFRTLLTDAVERRLAASTRTVSHLSGGLDGSSIAAAAHILTGTGALDPRDFVTVSAIVPGHETDESLWIDEITTAQPFPHRDFTPRIGPIEDYAHDMAVTGTPVAHHVRDLVAATADIAIEEGADLVLTGNGGDDVTNDRWVLPELVRTGHGRAWLRAMRSMAGDSPGAAALWGVSSVGSALPAAIKKRLRRSSTETTGTSLLAPRLRTLLEANRTEDTQRDSNPSHGTSRTGAASPCVSTRRPCSPPEGSRCPTRTSTGPSSSSSPPSHRPSAPSGSATRPSSARRSPPTSPTASSRAPRRPSPTRGSTRSSPPKPPGSPPASPPSPTTPPPSSTPTPTATPSPQDPDPRPLAGMVRHALARDTLIPGSSNDHLVLTSPPVSLRSPVRPPFLKGDGRGAQRRCTGTIKPAARRGQERSA